jgi:iron uptake system component EfeO
VARAGRAAPRAAAVLVAAALVGALVASIGWRDDDGRTVRNVASTDATTAASPSATSAVDRAAVEALVAQRLSAYREQVVADLDESIEAVDALRTAAAAGERVAAQDRYGRSRAGWMRAQPLVSGQADLVAVIDGAPEGTGGDARDAATGWPALELVLWDDGVVTLAEPLAAQLGTDLATLRDRVAAATLTTRDVVDGARALSRALADRAASPPSRAATDWWDIANGLAGLRAALDTLTPALESRHASLLASLDSLLADATTTVEPYRDGTGYRPFTGAPDELRDTLDELRRRVPVVAIALGTG